jgi:hypothetical protein
MQNDKVLASQPTVGVAISDLRIIEIASSSASVGLLAMKESVIFAF